MKKSVRGPEYIDDDEHNKNQMLLGLGCVLVAIGAPIIGFFGKQVDKGERLCLLAGGRGEWHNACLLCVPWWPLAHPSIG